MSELLNITIDGKECTCEPGELLYDVAKRNGIFIPALCRNDDFDDHLANCRVCIVEVKTASRTRVVSSCNFPLTQPCEVFTQSDKIKEERGLVLGLLHQRAPESESISQMNNFMGAGDIPEFTTLADSRCVMCGRCVQACRERGASAIGTIGRGTSKYVGAPFGKAPKPCIGCLQCAKACPTENIPYSEDETTRSIWGRTFTLAFCENCGKMIGTMARQAYKAKLKGENPVLLCKDCKAKK